MFNYPDIHYKEHLILVIHISFSPICVVLEGVTGGVFRLFILDTITWTLIWPSVSTIVFLPSIPSLQNRVFLTTSPPQTLFYSKSLPPTTSPTPRYLPPKWIPPDFPEPGVPRPDGISTSRLYLSENQARCEGPEQVHDSNEIKNHRKLRDNLMGISKSFLRAQLQRLCIANQTCTASSPSNPVIDDHRRNLSQRSRTDIHDCNIAALRAEAE